MAEEPTYKGYTLAELESMAASMSGSMQEEPVYSSYYDALVNSPDLAFLDSIGSGAKQIAGGAIDNIFGVGGMALDTTATALKPQDRVKGEGLLDAYTPNWFKNLDAEKSPLLNALLHPIDSAMKAGYDLTADKDYKFGDISKTAQDTKNVILDNIEISNPEGFTDNALRASSEYGLGNALTKTGGTLMSLAQGGIAGGVRESGGSPLTEALLTGGAGVAADIPKGLMSLVRGSEKGAEKKAANLLSQTGITTDELDAAIALKNADELNKYASTAELLDKASPARGRMAALQSAISKEFPGETADISLARNAEREALLRQGYTDANLSEGDLAEALRGEVAKKAGFEDERVKDLFQKVDKDNSSNIPVSDLRDRINQEIAIKANPKAGSEALGGKPLKLINEILGTEAESAPGLMKYQTLQNYRSRALGIPRIENLSDEHAAILAATQDEIIKTIDSAAKIPNTGFTLGQYNAWKKARAAYSDMVNVYGNDLVSSVGGLNKNSVFLENVLPKVLSSGKKNVEVLRRSVLGEKDPLLHDLRVAVLDEVVGKSKGVTDSFNAGGTATAYRKYGSAIEGLFDPSHKRILKRIADNTINQAKVTKLGVAASDGQSITPQILTNLDKIKQQVGLKLASTLSSVGGGASAGAFIGGLPGMVIGAGVPIAYSVIAQNKASLVMRKIFEASADPEVAKRLISPYKEGSSDDFINYITNKTLTPALVGITDSDG